MTLRFQKMIGDRSRTPILLKAIRRVVKKGDVVLDLGCGTGILSFAALRAGASKVYACDIDPIIHRTAGTAKKRGLADKIVFFQALSSDITLPVKVDVILSETVGSLGLDENILPFVADARRRFLKRGGTIIPERIAVFVAPVQTTPSSLSPLPSASAKASADRRGERVRERMITNVPFLTCRVTPDHLVAGEKKYCDVDLKKNVGSDFDRTLHFLATRNGWLSGFAGWFEVTWAPGLVTRTSPLDPPTHWKQGLLLNRKRETIHRGDRITFHLRIGPRYDPFSPESSIEWGYRIG